MKVLIVDDNCTFLAQLMLQVEDLGHEVVTATSGSEAFQVIQIKGPFDAIITDMQMKYGTGLELLEQLYLDANETPCRLHSSEATYHSERTRIVLAEAVRKYGFASFSLKTDFEHVEKFLAEVSAKGA